jgi:hypothetical protein
MIPNIADWHLPESIFRANDQRWAADGDLA